MTLEEANITEQELQQVRDNDLETNYEPHDIAEEFLTYRLERVYDCHVEAHGDDARHAEAVYFGDGPDQAVYHDEDDEEPVGYIEVKSKRLSTGEEWFGRVNRRHWNHYVEFAESVDVPVYIYMTLVDEDDGAIVREGFIEVNDDHDLDVITDMEGLLLTVHQEDVHIPANDESSDLRVIEVDDIISLERDAVINSIPDVKGNEVVCLDEKRCRSWMYLASELDL
jgi:hypothetical protein